MKCCLKLGLILLTILSFVSFLAPMHWVFDLFNHFRFHALLVSIIMLLMVYLLYRPLSLFAACIVAGNLILFLLPIYNAPDDVMLPSQEAVATKVLFANVYTSNDQYQKVMELINEQKPEIVSLIEIDDNWLSNLSELDKSYPYTLKSPRNDNFGMAVYAKKPFTSQMHIIGEYNLPMAVLDFDNFRLIVAHPIPPISTLKSSENNRYLDAIAYHARETDLPVILTGDLNNTLWSNGMATLMRTGLKSANPSGVAYTWPAYMPLFAMQIDHIFAKGLKLERFSVLNDIGSDHYPIQAFVNIKKK